ncbi:hypothetical protein Mapa_016029 [Marchantia paleacea]|nr:hypothetical protein Mapa_016029 [Marchantia paleacea]
MPRRRAEWMEFQSVPMDRSRLKTSSSRARVLRTYKWEGGSGSQKELRKLSTTDPSRGRSAGKVQQGQRASLQAR